MNDQAPASEIRTDRLLLRSWRTGDAPLLKQIIDSNLEHLQRWMPWARTEPSSLEVLEQRIEKFSAAFAAGEEWLYGIYAPDDMRLIGAIGLHRRIGPGGVEIGYWLDARECRKGFASEATAAMVTASFDLPHIDRIEIHCDAENHPSAAVPRRLGFELAEVVRGDIPEGAAEARNTMVWRMLRSGSRHDGVWQW